MELHQYCNNLHVVILNWNARDDTLRCLHQLLQWQDLKPRVWVVDNASDVGDTDAIFDAIEAHPSVTLIRSQSNRGFSGGSNLGIRAALDEAQLPILLLNNDAALSEECAKRLLQTLTSSPQNGIVGPLLFGDAAHARLLSAGSRNPVLHHHNQILVPPATERAIVDYISGSVALVRPELFERVGLFDEKYFFSGEVADLCRRARQQGLLCVVDAQAKAHHNLDRSAPQRGTLHTYYIVRNRFLYIRKFYQLLRLPLTLLWAAYGALLIWKLRLSGNRISAKVIEMATRDGLTARFGGQNERVLAAVETVEQQVQNRGKEPS